MGSGEGFLRVRDSRGKPVFFCKGWWSKGSVRFLSDGYLGVKGEGFLRVTVYRD